jgi:hypothetical protein
MSACSTAYHEFIICYKMKHRNFLDLDLITLLMCLNDPFSSISKQAVLLHSPSLSHCAKQTLLAADFKKFQNPHDRGRTTLSVACLALAPMLV